jgi:hypothetical protein
MKLEDIHRTTVATTIIKIVVTVNKKCVSMEDLKLRVTFFSWGHSWPIVPASGDGEEADGM